MFDHAQYHAAVQTARDAARVDAQAEILDFKVDDHNDSLVYLRLRFLSRVHRSDFVEGGSAVQRDESGFEVFAADIVTLDEATGEVVVEIRRKSGLKRPDPSLRMVLNPPDFLSALAEFASNIADNPGMNPETRFDCLHKSLLNSVAAGPNISVLSETNLRQEQKRAIDNSMREPFVFIWGPPGTGKSHTLGYLAAQWRKRGKKVLVLAHTNAAVDVTTLAIDNACRDINDPLVDAELIRYTRSLTKHDEYERRPHLLAFTRLLESILKREAALVKELAELRHRLARAEKDSSERKSLSIEEAMLTLRINSIGQQRKSEIKALLENASIVCVSVTGGLFADILSSFKFDAVVVDEASLIPLAAWPWLLHAWQPNSNPHFAVAGDPMQLQPIFQMRNIAREKQPLTSAWFERNIYAHLVIDSMASASAMMNAGTLVFLNEQFRMGCEIRKAVSRTFYGGRLVGDGTNLIPKWPEGSMVPCGQLIALDPDKSVPSPQWYKTGTTFGLKSRPVNISITMTLVRRMVEAWPKDESKKLSILVVSPFRDQSREYEKRLMAMHKPKNISLAATTVHRAQGSEADVVIFDVVDASSWFVRCPDASSLWCVACSRAKSQLFLIGGETAMRRGTFSSLMVQGVDFIGFN